MSAANVQREWVEWNKASLEVSEALTTLSQLEHNDGLMCEHDILVAYDNAKSVLVVRRAHLAAVWSALDAAIRDLGVNVLAD